MSRIIAIIFITIALLIFGAICVLPPFISTPWGTEKAVALFNRLSSGHLSVKKLNLRWFGDQRIENLTYEDKREEKVASVELFETKTSLFYLLFGGRTFGSTEIRDPYLVIEEKEKKNKPKKKKSRVKTWEIEWPTFSDKIEISNGTVIFKSPYTSPITLSEIQVETQKTPPIYYIHAKSIQGDQIGKIDVAISLEDITHISGTIQNFPVAVLDQINDTTLFTTAIGNTLNLNFNLTKDREKTMAISATIKSKNLNGLIEGQVEQKKLYFSPSNQLIFTITPRLFQEILPESQKEQWQLASDTKVTIEITQGVIPLSLKKIDLHSIMLQGNGEIARAEINHKTLSGFSLNHFKFELAALNNNLELAFQGIIQGKESSMLTGTASYTPDGDLLFTLNSKGFPVSFVGIFSPEVEKNLRTLVGNTFDLNCEGTFKEGQLDTLFSLIAPNLQLDGTVKGSLPQLKFQITGIKKLPGKLGQYIGSTLDLKLKGSVFFSESGFSIPQLSGTVSSPYYTFDVKGKFGQQIALDTMELSVKGEMHALPMGDEFPDVELKNGDFSINIDGPKNKINGQATINTQVQTSEGPLNSKALKTHFEITDFIYDHALDFKKANIKFDSDLNGLPLALLNPFMPEDLDLTLLAGKMATIKAQGSYTPTQEPSGRIDLTAKGEGFDAALSLTFNQTLELTPNRPAYIHWELNAERYDMLMHLFAPDYKPNFLLSRPASVDLSIHELHCPTTPPKSAAHFICQSGFVGNLKVGTLSFISYQTQEYLVVKDLSGSLQGYNLSEALEFKLGGEILAQNIPHSETSTFTFQGTMLNVWTPEGKFNREGLAIEGELSVELLPVKELTEVFPLDNETRQLLQAVLGKLMNARVYGTISQLTGPLTVDVKASNFKATLPIMLNPHAIYLRDYVNAEITLTEEVNQTFIKDINPLLITGAYSDHPIKVYLDPQGFVMPIRPYSLQGVQIGKAVIDIGKIRIRNGGQIQMLMNFLKAKDITPEGEMDAWFTPIYMSLNNGVATYQRFDALLAGSVHIAFWGSINLLNNQVRMTLGIAAPTLQKRFGISGLNKNEMFQVKMRGTTDKLDLDWSAATTRIGVLVARSAGGQLTNILGGLLEQIVSALGEVPSPPPTTVPFPWETQK